MVHKCAACGVPLFADLEIRNTDATFNVTCSCGTINRVTGMGGSLRVSVATTYRHPDFIKGTDVERWKLLKQGARAVDDDIRHLTELKVAIVGERDRLFKTVQNTLVTKHQAEDAVSTLGTERIAEVLAATMTEDQLAALFARMGKG